MRLATCHVLEPPTEASVFTLREALLVSVWPSAVVLNAPGAPVENWLDTQIRFDASWETKVVDRILHNLSLLMNESFKSVQELNRFRKQINAGLT